MENKFEISSLKRKLMEYLIPEEIESGSLKQESSVAGNPNEAGFIEISKFMLSPSTTEEERKELSAILNSNDIRKATKYIKGKVGGFGTPFKL